jgi:alpha-tubulin suppressor-like RCC1 family protein
MKFMSYSHKFLLCVLLLFLTNALKAIEVLQFPSSLTGKVMVAYWGNGNDYECYFFKNENDFVFVDVEESGAKKYSWNPSAKILTNHDFGEDISLTLTSPYGGQFTIREGNQQLGSGTFVLYDSLWDLDRNGVADGRQIQDLKLPDFQTRLDFLGDQDEDGLVLAAELRMGTNPTLSDTDRDGYSDGHEVAFGMDPKTPKAISAGGDSSFYLDPEGRVWAVGDNEDGQLGDGTKITAYTPRLIMTEVKAISAGDGYTLMLKKNGTVWATGENWAGQLGDGTQTDKVIPVQVMSNVFAISAGDEHSLFLKTDGTLWACGHNEDGQLGDGTKRTRTLPVKVMSGVQSMSAGGAFSIFLKTDGTAWASGENWAGQIGDGTNESRITPVQIMSGVKAVSAGMDHGLYLKTDGSLWSAGGNWAGQLGDGTTTYQSSPIQVISNVMAMAAGDDFSAIVTNDGGLFLAGDRGLGIQGIEPVQIMSDAQSVSAGADHLLILKNDGSIWAQGYNESGSLGSSDPPILANPAVMMTGAKAVDAGPYHSLILKDDGTAWAVGDNFVGALGDGTFESRSYPVQVLANVQAVATGENHSMFLKTDGSVWISGIPLGTQVPDDYDYLYLDYRAQFAVTANPKQFMTDVKAIASGVGHSLFLKNDGSVWAAGENWEGQLGIASNEYQTSAVKVMDGVKAIAAGDRHSFFLKNDGSLWGVGLNEEGQLGDGTLTNRKVPVFIMKDVKALARPHAGDHSLFLKIDGSVWGTGRNTSGELGIGTYRSVNVPVKIMTDVVDMAAGSSHSFFLKSDKTLWASGANESGQLGNGTMNGSNLPILVMSGVRSMSCGEIHSLFLKEDGTVLASGNRYYGKLGDGYDHDESYPVKSFNIPSKLPQTIGVISPIPPKSFGAVPFSVALPSASSKLPVTLSVKSGPATIKGNKLTITGVGTVLVAANQAGNANYEAAPEVTTSFVVSKAAQTIRAFSKISSKTFGVAPFAITIPSASSKLPVTLSVKSGPASISGNVVSISGVGTVVLAANQAGNDNYSVATEVTVSFTVVKATQRIGPFVKISAKTVSAAPFDVTPPSSNRGLPVTLSVKSGPAKISGNKVTLTGVGTVVLAANQAGNANYLAARQVTTSFKVTK